MISSATTGNPAGTLPWFLTGGKFYKRQQILQRPFSLDPDTVNYTWNHSPYREHERRDHHHDQKNQDRGIHQLYAEDPERADWIIWGRRTDPVSRRGFLRGSGLAAMTVALGAPIVFAEFMPGGLIPVVLAQSEQPFSIPGKDGLRILNDRPLNAETPAHLLDDAVTPASRLFVRNNGIPPEVEGIDADAWTLEFGGESCETPTTFTLAELRDRFPHHSYQLQLECGGNGRSEFFPPARGNQWTTGAVGCPTFTGVRLRDVLEAVGIKDDAVYVGYYGADIHLSGAPDKVVISRGVPMDKALRDETPLAFAMNDEPLPVLHGFPLRLVASGFPASGLSVEQGKTLALRGKAWAGEQAVKEMYVSTDFGATWHGAILEAPVNRHAWQPWQAEVDFPQAGYYEVWARAVDDQGVSQPMVLPGWNPRGYLNNACHRIAVQVV